MGLGRWRGGCGWMGDDGGWRRWHTQQGRRISSRSARPFTSAAGLHFDRRRQNRRRHLWLAGCRTFPSHGHILPQTFFPLGVSCAAHFFFPYSPTPKHFPLSVITLLVDRTLHFCDVLRSDGHTFWLLKTNKI